MAWKNWDRYNNGDDYDDSDDDNDGDLLTIMATVLVSTH